MVKFMNTQNLIQYYNKFNEDKRLTRRHGIVEYETTMHYIKKYLKSFDNPKILDIGAGTGAYSIKLANQGYDVTAIELVKHNLMTLKNKSDKVKAFLGNALDLSKFKSDSFDIVLLFGPIYHLIDENDKLKCLQEAKRVLKNNGLLFISYYMNEYAVITHGFRDNAIKSSIKEKLIDETFHIQSKDDDLYSFVRVEDINRYKDIVDLKRVEIIAQDGPSDYIRPIINSMDEETFELYLKYHLQTCDRFELLGASSHVLDILKK